MNSITFKKSVHPFISLSCIIAALFLMNGCSNSDDIKEDLIVQEVTHEVELFEYTVDQSARTSRFQYRIRFDNPNDFEVNGYAEITYKIGYIEVTPLSVNGSMCGTIAANDSCFVERDVTDRGFVSQDTDITLVSVKYVIIED